MNICPNTSSPSNFPRENFRSTGDCWVTKISKKASFHNMPLTLSWSVWARTSDSRWRLPHLAKNEPRTFHRTWRSWRCAHTVVLLNKYTCLFADFLWFYSHHHPMESLPLVASVDWKFSRRKFSGENVFEKMFAIVINCSWLAFSDKSLAYNEWVKRVDSN